MPNCTKCGVMLGYTLWGGICPKCKTRYLVSQVKAMPDYDELKVMEVQELFNTMAAAGILGKGFTTVEVYEDGILIGYEEPRS